MRNPTNHWFLSILGASYSLKHLLLNHDYGKSHFCKKRHSVQKKLTCDVLHSGMDQNIVFQPTTILVTTPGQSYHFKKRLLHHQHHPLIAAFLFSPISGDILLMDKILHHQGWWFYRVLTIPGGAGFCPSTVVFGSWPPFKKKLPWPWNPLGRWPVPRHCHSSAQLAVLNASSLYGGEWVFGSDNTVDGSEIRRENPPGIYIIYITL